LPTRFDELNIFLVSADTNTNATISSGPQLLTGQTGSVRNVNFLIPSCIPTGKYNLTFYEFSHIDGQPFFTITPIPISVTNNNPSGDCSDILNVIEPQPQPSFPFGESPFLPNSTTTGTSATTTGTSATTVVGPTTASESQTDAQSSLTPTITTTVTATPGTQQEDNSGFIPVNSSRRERPLLIFPWLSVICVLAHSAVL